MIAFYSNEGDLSSLIFGNITSQKSGKEFGDYQYYLSFGGDQVSSSFLNSEKLICQKLIF